MIVLRESGNKLLKKLFANDSNKLNVASHAATIGHTNKTRVTLSASKPISATSPVNKQHKKTVSVFLTYVKQLKKN